MTPGRSTGTLEIAHNVLMRAVRQAKRDDLVGRNVAALVDTPKGQQPGRPSHGHQACAPVLQLVQFAQHWSEDQTFGRHAFSADGGLCCRLPGLTLTVTVGEIDP